LKWQWYARAFKYSWKYGAVMSMPPPGMLDLKNPRTSDWNWARARVS
jgi:hypothetical protein